MLHPDHGGSHDEFLEFMKQAKGDHQPDNAKQTAVSEMLSFLQSVDLSSAATYDIPREVATRLKGRAGVLIEQLEQSERVADDLEKLAGLFTEECIMSLALLGEADRLRRTAAILQPQIDDLHAAAEYAETVGFKKEETCNRSESYTTRGSAYW